MIIRKSQEFSVEKISLDRRISFLARGLAIFLNSQLDETEIPISKLINIGKAELIKIRHGFNELLKTGYMDVWLENREYISPGYQEFNIRLKDSKDFNPDIIEIDKLY